MTSKDTCPDSVRTRQRISVKKIAVMVPGCETGRHTVHPGLTCDQADEQIAADQAFLDRCLSAATAMRGVPAALRGPAWSGDE
ncbi:hypothetical protein ABZ442_05015 [Streptomyces triculaminicus]|uniref:hypothetical protein n=1 Tax=Streptomyces triculaminicus TaxID=2816232 RepID=UPI00340B6751